MDVAHPGVEFFVPHFDVTSDFRINGRGNKGFIGKDHWFRPGSGARSEGNKRLAIG